MAQRFNISREVSAKSVTLPSLHRESIVSPNDHQEKPIYIPLLLTTTIGKVNTIGLDRECTSSIPAREAPTTGDATKV